MKLTQIAIAVITTTLVIFAWSFTFWEVINPLELIYQSHTVTANIDSVLEETRAGLYFISSQAMPRLNGWLIVSSSDSNLISIIIKSLSTSFLASLFACIFILVSNLHRCAPTQRFFSLIMLGFLFILQSFLPLIHGNQIQWNLLLVHLVFDTVFWLIIAISLTAQAGIKKRNIFLEK